LEGGLLLDDIRSCHCGEVKPGGMLLFSASVGRYISWLSAAAALGMCRRREERA